MGWLVPAFCFWTDLLANLETQTGTVVRWRKCPFLGFGYSIGYSIVGLDILGVCTIHYIV